MHWVICVAGIICFTAVSGSIAFVIWKICSLLFQKNEWNSELYKWLKWLIFAFLVPVVGIIMLILAKMEIDWHCYLFLMTSDILSVSLWMCNLYLAGALVMGVGFVANWLSFQYHVKEFLPAGWREQQIFMKIQKRMGMEKKTLRLQVGCGVRSPFIYGMVTPCIVLPDQELSEKELNCIFIHELTHIGQKDLFWKWLSLLAVQVQWFNPFAWMMCAAVQRWSEYACDEQASWMMKSTKDYFSIILKIAERGKWNRGKFMVTLFEGKHEIVDRIEHMRKYGRQQAKEKRRGAIAGVIVFLIIGVTVMTAANAMAAGYMWIYNDTLDETIIENQPRQEKIIEYANWNEYLDSGITIESGIWNLEGRSGNLYSFTWSLGNMVLKQSDQLVVNQGNAIKIWIYKINPSVKLKVGIKNCATGKTQSTWVEADDSCSFAIAESGAYRCFVQNNSGKVVQVEGVCTVIN